MEIRHINISSTNGEYYTASILNVTKGNILLGSLQLQGDKTNLTIPFNAAGFNPSTHLSEGDQLVLQILRDGCAPYLSNIWNYYPQNPTSFTAENATKTKFGITRFLTNVERDNENSINLAADAADLIYFYRKGKFVYIKSSENLNGSVSPIFVEFYYDNDQTPLFKKSISKVDGVLVSNVALGSSAYILLPNRSIVNGFSSLDIGQMYGYNLSTGLVEDYSASNIYIGKAISETQIQFDSSIESTFSLPALVDENIGSRKFVEIFTNVNGDTLIKTAIKKAHGFLLNSKTQGQTASFLQPNQKISGFSNLLPGSIYAVENGDLVIFDPENVDHIPTALAVSETDVYFNISLDSIVSNQVQSNVSTATLLPQSNALVNSPFTLQLQLSSFTLNNGELANVTAVSWPHQSSIVKDSTKFTINWVPDIPGEFFILFWVENENKKGKIVSKKISVSSSNLVPEGGLVLASTSLSAGMFVNIFDDGGTPKLRPALANSINTIAHGFVIQNVAAGQSVKFYSYGTNPFLNSLTPGNRYCLSPTVPGGIVLNPPAPGSNLVWQPVGKAISNLELIVSIDNYVLMS